MKTIKVALASLLLLTIAIVYSCQKDNSNTLRSKSESLSLLTPAEQALLNKLESIAPAKSRAMDEKTKKVIGADCTGAVEGAAAGSIFGPWGAAIGAVIGAAGASLTASASIANPGTTGGGIGQGNPANPFDELGVHHNAYLSINVPGYACNGGCNPLVYGLGENYVSANMGLDPTPYQPVLFPAINEVYDLVNNLENTDIPEILNQLLQNGRITPVQAATTTLYYNTVLSQPQESFFAASVQFENEVINSGISEDDKNAILAGLAVGRYSYGFWTGGN